MTSNTSPRSSVNGSSVQRIAETRLPTKHADFTVFGYRDHLGVDHVAITLGLNGRRDDPTQPAPLVRVHSECLTGDALGSYRCDCGEQLDAALAAVADAGRGGVIYVRGHEGRGIGLAEKLRAYALQDDGLDTVEANVALGHPGDVRSYDQSAQILADLGWSRIRLLTSNPAKQAALLELGVTVEERVHLAVPERPENARYLATKRQRMDHDDAVDAWSALLAGRVPTLAGDPLVSLYGPLVSSGAPLVIAQLGQSLDGFIASRTGDAEFVTGPEDRLRLHRMRALVDAVVVGATTVISDDCRLTVRDCPGDNPVRVVVDPRGRVGATALLLTDDAAPTLWLVGPEADVPDGLPEHVSVQRLSHSRETAPTEVLRLLAERGLNRVLIEGGGRLVSSFVAAGAIDRLYVTTAPVLIGDGVPGLRFDGEDALRHALRGRARHFSLGEDVCTELVLDGRATEGAPSR